MESSCTVPVLPEPPGVKRTSTDTPLPKPAGTDTPDGTVRVMPLSTKVDVALFQLYTLPEISCVPPDPLAGRNLMV